MGKTYFFLIHAAISHPASVRGNVTITIIVIIVRLIISEIPYQVKISRITFLGDFFGIFLAKLTLRKSSSNPGGNVRLADAGKRYPAEYFNRFLASETRN